MCTFARVLVVWYATHVASVSVRRMAYYESHTHNKIQKDPILVQCTIYDFIEIHLPSISENAKYYLYKPNGDEIKLKFTDMHGRQRSKDDSLKASKYTVLDDPYSIQVFSLNDRTTYSLYDETVDGNVVIGPVLEDDHGNWVLSAFYTDDDNQLVEEYRVISIEVTEVVPCYPCMGNNSVTLKHNEHLVFGLAYPIKDLETCEVIAPFNITDRYIERDLTKMEFCGYILPSVYRMDAGMWKIVAVGKIIYTTEVYLTIESRSKKSSKH